MKSFIALLLALSLGTAFAAETSTSSAAVASSDGVHRYMIERTFPAGALDGLNAAIKEKVNANNASVGVSWKQSYANEDKTKTFCVYEGPNEAAIRKAAILNGLPIDKVTEVPLDLAAPKHSAPKMSAAATHRFIVERTLTAGELDGLDAAAKAKVRATNAGFGVYWVKSYASADKTKTYGIYEGPSESAVRSAAGANGILIGGVTEVPVTLLPK
jgi:hypothetical protein